MSAQDSCSQVPRAHLASSPSNIAKTHPVDHHGAWDPQRLLLEETPSHDSRLLGGLGLIFMGRTGQAPLLCPRKP